MPSLSRLLLPALLLGAALPLAAAAQQGPAGRFLEARHAQAERVLRRPVRTDRDRERRNAQLETLVSGLLDYEALGRGALGDAWEARSEAERARFVELLRKLVERSYQESLERTVDYTIRYVGEEPRGDEVLVRTTARSRQNRRAPEVSIDYRMTRSGDGWKVVDVVTDGVSMVRNYRSQFSRIMRRDGWEGLISRMESRLADEP